MFSSSVLKNGKGAICYHISTTSHPVYSASSPSLLKRWKLDRIFGRVPPWARMASSSTGMKLLAALSPHTVNPSRQPSSLNSCKLRIILTGSQVIISTRLAIMRSNLKGSSIFSSPLAVNMDRFCDFIHAQSQVQTPILVRCCWRQFLARVTMFQLRSVAMQEASSGLSCRAKGSILAMPQPTQSIFLLDPNCSILTREQQKPCMVLSNVVQRFPKFCHFDHTSLRGIIFRSVYFYIGMLLEQLLYRFNYLTSVGER